MTRAEMALWLNLGGGILINCEIIYYTVGFSCIGRYDLYLVLGRSFLQRDLLPLWKEREGSSRPE